MIKKINMPVHKFTIKEDDERFLRMELWLCTIGRNLNDSSIDKKAYELSKDTIEYIPMCGKLNASKTKFLGHEDDEKPCGVVLDFNNNNYRYEIDESNGLEYVVVDAILFKNYCEDEAEIILDNDGKYNISMEIEVEEGKFDKDEKVYIIEKFTYKCVTIIGCNPGMEGAHLEVFNKAKYCEMIDFMKNELNEYFKLKNSKSESFIKKSDIGTDKSIKIDLSKESADMFGDWNSIDKTKLINDVLFAKNYKACVNACYLVVEDGYENNPLEYLKLPVGKISNDKLILSANACESAFSFLEKNTSASYYTQAKAKLKRYYKKLGLDTEKFSDEIDNQNNFEDKSSQDNQIKKEDELMIFNKEEYALKFGLTTNQLYEELNKVCSCSEKYIDEYWGGEFCRYGLRDYDDQNVYARDYKEGKFVKIPYSMKGDNPCLDMENVKRVKTQYVDWEDGDSDDTTMSEFSKEQSEFAKKEFEKVKEALTNTKTELENVNTEFSKLKTESETKNTTITEFTTKLEERDSALLTLNTQYSDLTAKYTALEQTVIDKDTIITNKNEKLEIFKNELEKYKLEEKKDEANNIIKEYSNVLSKEEIDSFTEKATSCETMDAFRTEIKLFVCDKLTSHINSGNKQNFSSMALINNEQQESNQITSQSDSVWDRLKDNK